MRGVARFETARTLATGWRRVIHRSRVSAYLAACEQRFSETVFTDVDRFDFVRRLRNDGIALGLRIPPLLVNEIVEYAHRNPCFADRRTALGFRLEHRGLAEERVGKPILVAQYFNTIESCGAVARLLEDPLLRWIAAAYLESIPTFVGANLWWTFPVKPLEADRSLHAHLFHRDVDDFRFFKYFFYLTPVARGDGAHVCVVASHRNPPLLRPGDRWNIRRYSDDEIEGHFPADRILEVCGEAGTGFAENTLCVHKGLTPKASPRLLIQLQFALFDYGVMHDKRDPVSLRMIA